MGAVGVSPSALPLRAVERMGAVCVLPSVPSPHVVVRVKFPILPRASAATATHAVVYTYGTSNVSFPSSRVGASFFGSTTPLLQAGFDVSGVGLCCEQGQGKAITEKSRERLQKSIDSTRSLWHRIISCVPLYRFTLPRTELAQHYGNSTCALDVRIR